LSDNAEIGELTHQLCCQHLLRDLAGAAETYPGAHWPTQIADALRGLIHQANLARDTGRDRIDADIAHLIETRDALDVLIRANSRHRAELSTTPEPVAQSA